MIAFVVGLALFLGLHSIRIVAEPMRTWLIDRLGANGWKGAYSIVSIASFALLVWGYSQARMTTSFVWIPPTPMRHIAALLTLVAFVIFLAAYVPKNHIKARLHHPMMLGVKVWAFAHLIANGSLVDMVLFGSFLAWAIAAFRAARIRDRAAGTTYPAGTGAGTAMTVVAGVAAWAVFAFWAHGVLIGVRPLGM